MSADVDLDRFPSLAPLADAGLDSWTDSDVPLARRGVAVSWLVGMVRSLLDDINAPRAHAIQTAERAHSHNRAGLYGMHDQPDMVVPHIPEHALLNVRSLVQHFVLPLTAALRAPLWALVPDEHRGAPDRFVSHTWNSLLLGPPDQSIGTLDAIEHLSGNAWIDFVAYNQHTIESIPTDMEQVVGEIGKVVFAGTPVPTLGRIWCLWELLCANRTGTDFDIAIKPGYRNDKILAVNTLYRSFVGVDAAVATKPEDREIISAEVLAQFGSAEAANEHLDRILREQLSGSWYELRDRDQHLGFRPWPWLYEQMDGGEKLAKRWVRETEPYYGPSVRAAVVYGTEQPVIDMLIDAGLRVGGDELAQHQVRTATRADIALIQACRDGDVDTIRALLAAGTDPERVTYLAAPLAHAARAQQLATVQVLLAHGVDVEGGTGLSPLACAARTGDDDLVRLLVGHGADLEGDAGAQGTALFQAADLGHVSTVRLLLELGADANAKTDARATPLLVATSHGHADVVDRLIEAGADLNCTDRSGDTALHHAAHQGWAAIVDALVAAGADRTVVDKYGETAHDIGVREGRVSGEVLDRLRP